MLLCTQGYTLQSKQNLGLLNLTATSFALTQASARFANAPPYTQASMFCLLSSEADLLTGKKC